MLESQFYTSIILRALVGLIVFKTVVKFAKHNPADESAKAGIWQKVFGGVFGLLALGSLFSFFVGLSRVVSPTEMLQVYSPNMIIRPSYVHLVWGYSTPEQFSVLSAVSGFFTSLATAGYILCFRKSPTSWWKKVLKVLLIALIYMFYYSSVDFHYFDSHEFVAPGLLAVCLAIASWRIKKKRSGKKVEKTATDEDLSVAETEAEVIFEEKPEVKMVDEEVVESEAVAEEKTAEDSEESSLAFAEVPVVEEKIEVKEPEPMLGETMFCSYCGKRIEADSKFCKYCGEKL